MSCRPNDPGSTHHEACACREAAHRHELDELRLHAARLEESTDTFAASVRAHRAALVDLVDAAGGGPSGRRSEPGELGDALDRARKVRGR